MHNLFQAFLECQTVSMFDTNNSRSRPAIANLFDKDKAAVNVMFIRHTVSHNIVHADDMQITLDLYQTDSFITPAAGWIRRRTSEKTRHFITLIMFPVRDAVFYISAFMDMITHSLLVFDGFRTSDDFQPLISRNPSAIVWN